MHGTVQVCRMICRICKTQDLRTEGELLSFHTMKPVVLHTAEDMFRVHVWFTVVGACFPSESALTCSKHRDRRSRPLPDVFFQAVSCNLMWLHAVLHAFLSCTKHNNHSVRTPNLAVCCILTLHVACQLLTQRFCGWLTGSNC